MKPNTIYSTARLLSITSFLASAGLALSGCGGTSADGNEADPIVADLPIAYIKRNLIPDDNENISYETDLREPAEFIPGAALYIRSSATIGAPETNITDSAFSGSTEFADPSLYDVKDIEVSYDGTKLIFAMRAPEIENADDDEQPTWNIWEYDRSTATLRRIISSDIIAEGGDDIAPYYLPNGKIVFSSTRHKRSKAILLDELKPQFSHLDERRNTEAFSLHLMRNDGSDIEQITFNQSHDLDPTILADGRILFSRWDNAANRNRISLYTIYPDGSKLSLLYGFHSHNSGTDGQTVQFVQSRVLEDGSLLVALRPFNNDHGGMDFNIIDFAQYSDNTELIDGSEATDSAQSSYLDLDLRTDNSLSLEGRINSLYPLIESRRVLLSWSPCLVTNEERDQACTEENIAAIEAGSETISEIFPRYGIWSYDLDEDDIRPILPGKENAIYHEPVALEARTLPPLLENQSINTTLQSQSLGQIHIRSVYDFDGIDTSRRSIAILADPSVTPADGRPYRFLRIVKAVSIPDDDLVEIDNTAFGVNRQQLMREIIGYVPIEPDGSALFTVPANIPIALSILDKNGSRVSSRHLNWLHVAAGETLSCNGCHISASSRVPHGRDDATLASINDGASTDGAFPNAHPDITAKVGETMAEAVGARTPSVNITFSDEWSNPNTTTPAADFSYRYLDLTGEHPVSSECQLEWTPRCRIVINYEQHIAPLWSQTRQALNSDDSVLSDNTCTLCHNSRDSDNTTQVPAGQLELTATPSLDEPNHLTSYRELLFNDNEQELVDGLLVDREEIVVDENGQTVFQTDGDGNLITDGDGTPVPLTRTFTVQPVLSTDGSQNSDAFFNKLSSFNAETETVDHRNILSSAELKLLREWIDIGAQYFNNPFDLSDD